MTVRELIIKIAFKDQGNTAERTTKKIDNNIQRIIASSNRMGRTLSRVGGRMNLVLATIAAAAGTAVAAFSKLSKLASDNTAALNVAGVAFKGLSDETIAWARTTARQVGVADSALITLSSRIQLSLSKITGSIQEGARLTKQLVPLGVGIARAFGRPVEDALFAITRGIQGEEEQLRKFGIETTDAALKQFAFEKGLKTSITALTQNQKALLRTAKILEETSDFQAFATKGLKTFSGALAALRGRLTTLGATIGRKLQPLFVSFFNATRIFIDQLNEALNSTDGFIKSQNALVEIVARSLKTISALGSGVIGLAQALVKLTKESRAFSTIAIALSLIFVGWFAITFPLITALGALFVALDEVFAFIDGQDSVLDNFLGSLQSVKNVIKGIPRLFEFWKDAAIQALDDIADRFTGFVSDIGQSIKSFFSGRIGGAFADAFNAVGGDFSASLQPSFVGASAAGSGGTSANFSGDIIVNQAINGGAADSAAAIGQETASAVAQSLPEQLRKANRDLAQGG